MKIIKPLYLSDKNLISYLLAPLTVFTFLINFSKNFSVKKKCTKELSCSTLLKLLNKIDVGKFSPL